MKFGTRVSKKAKRLRNQINLSISPLKFFILTIFDVLGMDGGRFDWVKVRTTDVNDLLMCNFYSFLDGNDHEMGSGCTITG